MSAIRAAMHELIGLFVEDGAFALTILGVTALAAICALALPAPAWAAGAILLFGALAALAASVVGAAAKARR